MGSAVAAPPWLAIVGLASFVTLGHVAFLIAVLFLLTPPLAYLVFVNSLRRIGISNRISTFGGLVYVLTPALWSALNQGRLDILVLYLIMPCFIFVKPLMFTITEISWRRIFSLSLLAALVGSFSPLLLAAWLIIQIAFFLREAMMGIRGHGESAGWIDLLESADLTPVLRRFIVILTVFLLTLPWSLGAVLHPTQFLVAPGIPIGNGGPWQTLLTNPGGIGAPPWWIISPVPLLIFFSWFVYSVRRVTFYSSVILAGAIVLNALHISGHGATEPVYVGVAFLLIAVTLIPPMLKKIELLTPTLRLRNLGVRHIAVAGASILTLISTVAMAGWVIGGQSQSLVQSDQTDIVPAFVSSLAQSPAKPKTLVVNSARSISTFYISRGNQLAIGDADVAGSLPPQIVDAVNTLISGSGINSGQILGSFGIQYLFIKAPVSLDLARSIDGLGGFARMSATNIGTVWRIVGASSRVMLTDSKGINHEIPASDIGAAGTITTGGTISVAEEYDHSWRLIDNGMNIPLKQATNGLPTFTVNQPGKVTLLFDGTAHRGLVSLQLLSLLVAVVMALPSGRRRKQVPLEELV